MKELVAAIPPERFEEMDKGPDGRPAPSLINVLRHRRPIVIVDEAHNARTKLSFATLANTLPSCIIEFTATPDTSESASNVLHRVSAAELKTANMVKLPLGSQPQTVTVGVGNVDAGRAQAYAGDLAGKVRVDAEKRIITVFVPLEAGDEEKLLACVKTEGGRAAVAAAAETVRQIERAFGDGKPRVATPYELQADFFAPRTATRRPSPKRR
jgi:hypothetical protein